MAAALVHVEASLDSALRRLSDHLGPVLVGADPARRRALSEAVRDVRQASLDLQIIRRSLEGG